MLFPSRSNKRVLTQSAFVASFVMLSGCNWIDQMRTLFKPDAGEESTPAILKVRVTPEVEMSLWLDGQRISNKPNYQGEHPPGEHTFEVRAPGYHVIAVPLVLESGSTFELPIALRRDTGEPPRPEVTIPKKLKKAKPARPRPSGKPLPVQEHVRLQLVAQPRTKIRVDGQEFAGTELTLDRDTGTLFVGALHFSYQVIENRGLVLSCGLDSASWQRDGGAIQAGSTQRIGSGITRISRTDENGVTQAAVFKR